MYSSPKLWESPGLKRDKLASAGKSSHTHSFWPKKDGSSNVHMNSEDPSGCCSTSLNTVSVWYVPS